MNGPLAELIWIGIATLCLIFGYLAGRADERRRYHALGHKLSLLANTYGITRRADESDRELRARVKYAVDPSWRDVEARAARRFVGESDDAYAARLRRGGVR